MNKSYLLNPNFCVQYTQQFSSLTRRYLIDPVKPLEASRNVIIENMTDFTQAVFVFQHMFWSDLLDVTLTVEHDPAVYKASNSKEPRDTIK